MISNDCFCISALSEDWILSGGLERISEIASKGLVVEFCYEGEMKVKREGWIGVFNRLEIRLEIKSLSFFLTSR